MTCIEFVPLVRLLTITFSLVCLTPVNEVKAGERFYTMGATSRGQISLNKDRAGQPAGDSQVNLNETIRLLTLSIHSGGLEKDSLVLALNNRGIAYRLKGSYDRAIADYDRSIELRPDFAAGYSNRGLAFAKTGQYDVAIADFNQALKLKPADPNTYLRRGNAYYDQQAYDSAIADYSQAVELKPDFLSAYINRYDAYLKKGLAGKAVDDLKKIQVLDPHFKPAPDRSQLAICGKKSCIIREEPVREKPSPPSIIQEPTQPPRPDPVLIERQRQIQESLRINHEGVKCYNRKDFDCALQKFTEALKWNRDDQQIKKNLQDAMEAKATELNNKGYDFYIQGKYSEAITFFKEAWQYHRNPDIEKNLLKAEKAKQEKAAQQQKEAESLAKISNMVDNLSRDLGSSGSKAPLSSDTVDLTFLDPNKPIMVDPRVVKGTSQGPARESGKDQKRDAVVSKKEKPTPKERADKLVANGLDCFARGDLNGAIRYYRAALKETPNDESIQWVLGHSLWLRDDKGRKISNPKVEVLLDALKYGDKNWEKSISYLEGALATEKNKKKARPIKDALDYTRGLYAAEQDKERYKELVKQAQALADGELARLLAGEPDAKSQFDYGLQMIREEKYQEAVDTFKSLQKKDPKNEYIRSSLNFAEGLYAGKNRQSWFNKIFSR